MSSNTPPPGFPPYSNPPTGMPPGGVPLSAAAPLPGSAAPTKSAPTRKVVGLSRGIAIALAALTLLLVGYLTLTEEPPGLYVARAEISLSEMTQLDMAMVRVEPVPEQFLERGAISGGSIEAVEGMLEEIYGQVTRVPVGEGQQLRSEMFTGAERQLTPLRPSERLISMPAGVANAVGGALRPGDRVDVVVVDRREGIAGTVAVDIEVVAVRLSAEQIAGLSAEQTGPEGRELRPEQLQPAQPIPGLYTLRVPGELVPVLASASTEGVVHLVYRGVGGDEVTPAAAALLEAICRTTIPEMRPIACQELPLEDFGFADEFLDEFFVEESAATDGQQN